MKEIFDLQRTLNNRVCPFNGIVQTDDETWKAVWVEKYRLALFDEFDELFQEMEANGIGSQNYKVELIDILHFLASVSMIVGLTPQLAMAANKQAKFDHFFGELDAKMGMPSAIDVIHAFARLQNSLAWKWWSTGKAKYDSNKAVSAVMELWVIFWKFARVLPDFGFEEIKKVYVQKNRINHERQNRGYNEMTKTEDDNKSIEV